MPAAHAYAQAHADRFRQQWFDLLRIPSVSTLPEHAADVRRAAAWIAEDMRRIGLPCAEIIEKPGALPLVYGEGLGAGDSAPTVLFYSHYDVQPAAREDGWDSDPFTPLERDGRVYARGALDTKCHVLGVLKAIESLLAADDPAPVNVKLLFEGEEESDSAHIFGYVADHPDRLRCDVVALCDGSMPDPAQPILAYGVRGIVSMELTVSGPAHDLHSGQFGGSVHNPLAALAAILAAMHHADGTVAVPGFYDAVLPLGEAERARLAAGTVLDEAQWRVFTGAPQPWGEPAYALHERLAARPTLEFNGMWGGFQGAGNKTIIPARASAKISCRLVPDQQPEAIFALLGDFVAAQTPPTVRSELTLLEAGAPGLVADLDSAPMRATARAYEQAWGVPPLPMRKGGSLPVTAAFAKHLDCPLVLFAFGDMAGGAHGPNESMPVELFHRGIDTLIYFCHDLAAQA